MRDPNSVDPALGVETFDVVADFLSFTPDHVQSNIDRWAGKVGQYIFITSASACQTPPARIPVVESTPGVGGYVDDVRLNPGGRREHLGYLVPCQYIAGAGVDADW